MGSGSNSGPRVGREGDPEPNLDMKSPVYTRCYGFSQRVTVLTIVLGVFFTDSNMYMKGFKGNTAACFVSRKSAKVCLWNKLTLYLVGIFF